MINATRYELPSELKPVFKKAIKWEWITLIYLISVVILMYFVMGSSQAMKTSWLEDMLSIVPSIAFLISTKIYKKPPSKKYPYGFHRVFNIAALTGSVALFGVGLFLIFDSSMSLFKTEHPTIGSMMFFGNQIWAGWIMTIVLLYSSIPAMLLGYKKLPFARKLHNKILYTDAEMQKADYMTAFAAIAGLILVGYGLWWGDAIAALFISFSVLKDGYTNLKSTIKDLMDQHPVKVENRETDELVEKIEAFIREWKWVKDVRVRFRESGQVYIGEAIVLPMSDENLTDNISVGTKDVKNYHWRILDINISPVREIPEGL